MEEKPPPPDDDDYRERDISEDPFLAAVDADLNSVNRRNDYKLGIAIAVLPGPHMVMSAAMIERCAKCGNRLR